MARRSLNASTAGIDKAKKAFKMKQWTQEYLAAEVGLETRQPIWKFFTGKPIERQSFMEICFQLGLDWQEIAELPTQSLLTEKKQEWNYSRYIDTLVQMVRSRRSDKILAQCATMRLLDIAQPTQLEDIYVSLNVLNQISTQKWLDIFELQNLALEEFERCDFSEQRISAMQAVTNYPKLLVLGKPGAGKTTFLQHIATQCDRGKFLADQIPIFIRLKNFAEDARETGDFSLLNYIKQDLGKFGISDQQIQILLAHGRILFLLDGLDEISEDDSVKIVKKITDLSQEYYKNRFIITCRVASRHYQFDSFTDIEIADFDSVQIEAFVHKWFVNVGHNSPAQAKALSVQFVQCLHKPENRHIRELAVTPLLLNLACCVFQARADFPARRVELYQQALDILLDRWDRVRRIKRNENYSHLSLPVQLNLLSHIAAIAFKQDRYFFLQSSVLQYIMDYLRKLPTTQIEPEVLQLKSEALLKSFEARGLLVERARGIYSFSHLTFQEYLTAKNIVASPQPQLLEAKLSDLITHLTEPRWRKVFLLTASMLGNLTYLLELMKRHIDALVSSDEQLQKFLIWLEQKSLSVEAGYKPAAIRAFYLSLVLLDNPSLTYNLTLCFVIDPKLASHLTADLAIDLALNRALSLSLAFPLDSALNRVLALNFALLDDQTLVYNPQMQRVLQQLKQLHSQTSQGFQEGWNANDGQSWAEKLRDVMVECRNIGHQWQFNQHQQEVLKQYYTANQLLLDCLNSKCEVSPTLRDQILDKLLLPLAKTSDCALTECI